MSKLTVKEYATINRISVQSVYKRINNGNLEVREINNTKYIIINDLIDYEKKYNELKLRYELLEEKLKLKDEIINELKEALRFGLFPVRSPLLRKSFFIFSSYGY